jgi:hypothetical protein
MLNSAFLLNETLQGRNMTANASGGKQNIRTLIFLLFAFALLIIAAGWRIGSRAMKMNAGADVTAQLDQLKPGEEAKVVLEVTSSDAQNLRGKLLDKQTETLYKRSDRVALVAWDADTKVVMGKAADIHPGAVIHVTGSVVPGDKIMAQQIVILSGYVQVQ